MNEYNTDVTKSYGSKELEVLKPIQHPRNLHDPDTSIVSYRIPPKNLTPYERIPDQALAQLTLPCEESPQGARSLSVSLIGAANAGKSSLLNHIVNKHISAVSNKASTTDEAIMGVYTDVSNRT
jgi:ribosome biogenesis GTPase A